MSLKDEEVTAKTNWRLTLGEPSSALRRLWGKLLSSRKDKPADTHQDAGNGELKDGNERNVPNV